LSPHLVENGRLKRRAAFIQTAREEGTFTAVI
jgi:hypothetical protein